MKQLDGIQKPKSAKFNITEYTRILWRKKYFLLLPTLLAAVIAVVGVRFIVPVYKSSTLVRMEDQTSLFKDVPQLMTIEERRSQLDEEILAQMQAEIKSAEFLDRLIRQLGLADNADLVALARIDRQTRFPDLTLEELAYRRLREILLGKIQVTTTGPGLFRIAAFDHSPETAVIMASTIIDLVLESQRMKELKWLREATEFSDEQLDVYKARLDETEREFERVQTQLTQLGLQNNPVGETGPRYGGAASGESNLRYAETLKEQMETVIKNREGMVEQIHGRLLQQLGSIPQTKVKWEDPKLREMERGLIAFYETQLVLQLGARDITTEDQVAAKAALRQEEQAVQRHISDRVSVAYTDVPEDYRPLLTEYFFQRILLKAAKATRDRLAGDIAAYKNKLERTPRLEAQLETLRQRVATDRELYDSFLKAKTSAQITEAAQNTELGMSIEIIEKAVRPLRPDSPNRLRVLMFIVAVGGSLGLMGLVFSEYVDSSFRTVEEIEERLGLRVLGTIPAADVASQWRKAQNRKQAVIWMAVSAAAIVLSVCGFYIAGKKAQKQGIRVYSAQPSQQSQQ